MMKLSRIIWKTWRINGQIQFVNQVNPNYICDWACKYQPCDHKLHEVIFLLMSLVLNVIPYSTFKTLVVYRMIQLIATFGRKNIGGLAALQQ